MRLYTIFVTCIMLSCVLLVGVAQAESPAEEPRHGLVQEKKRTPSEIYFQVKNNQLPEMQQKLTDLEDTFWAVTGIDGVVAFYVARLVFCIQNDAGFKQGADKDQELMKLWGQRMKDVRQEKIDEAVKMMRRIDYLMIPRKIIGEYFIDLLSQQSERGKVMSIKALLLGYAQKEKETAEMCQAFRTSLQKGLPVDWVVTVTHDKEGKRSVDTRIRGK